jgi:hypothetical protein
MAASGRLERRRNRTTGDFGERWRSPRGAAICFARGVCVFKPADCAALETLEPSIHQFFPVEIYGVDGIIREPRCYLLNICQLVDAIVEGRYAVLNNGRRLYRASSRSPIKIRRPDVSNLHLWRDRRLAYQHFLVSDVLYRKIADAGYGAFDLGLSEEV